MTAPSDFGQNVARQPIASTTSDGISLSDWDRVRRLATRIANAAIREDRKGVTNATATMLALIQELKQKYGAKPSILATEADYTESLVARVALLDHAYELARQSSDARNMTYIAHSLAQVHVEETGDLSAARQWLGVLEKCLEVHSEAYEREDFGKLSAELRKQTRE